MGFKEQLTKLRKRNNITQSNLASLLNVKQYVISSWETGRSEPSIEQISKLSDIFNISIDYLLDKDIIFPENEQTFNNVLENIKLDAQDDFIKEISEICANLSQAKKKKMLSIIRASLEFDK